VAGNTENEVLRRFPRCFLRLNFYFASGKISVFPIAQKQAAPKNQHNQHNFIGILSRKRLK